MQLNNGKPHHSASAQSSAFLLLRLYICMPASTDTNSIAQHLPLSEACLRKWQTIKLFKLGGAE